MTIDEALDRINRAQTSPLLKERRDKATFTLVQGLLHELAKVPGPPEVVQEKRLSLAKWVDLRSSQDETYRGTDTIQGITLAQCP